MGGTRHQSSVTMHSSLRPISTCLRVRIWYSSCLPAMIEAPLSDIHTTSFHASRPGQACQREARGTPLHMMRDRLFRRVWTDTLGFFLVICVRSFHHEVVLCLTPALLTWDFTILLSTSFSHLQHSYHLKKKSPRGGPARLREGSCDTNNKNDTGKIQ